MVRLYEYQGKKILTSTGIRVPDGEVATTPADAKRIAQKIGGPVAIKSQIFATGRSKAGGIKFANSPEETEKVAGELLGFQVKGLTVNKVLVEQKLSVKREFYVGIIINSSFKVQGPTLMFSTEGGVDIEEVSAKHPEKVASMNLDPLRSVEESEIRQLISKFDLPSSLADQVVAAVLGLCAAFDKADARAAEINPLVVTSDGQVYAADCRITVDDSAAFRHPEFEIELPRDMDRSPTELERIAWTIEADDYRGVAYFAQLVPKIEDRGYVGFHGMGGGGAMLAADALTRHGFKLPDYSDTSGNPPASKVYRIAKILLSQPGIEGYVCPSPNMSNQELWYTAYGLVKAFREELADKPGFPVVVLWAGNKDREASAVMKRMLADLPIKLELYGREHLYDLDFIAERLKTLVEEYRMTSGGAK